MNWASIGIPVQDPTAVAQARRESGRIAILAGLNDQKAANLAIVVTEAATNLIKHTPGGFIALRAFDDAEGAGAEVLALDQGSGMDVARAIRDGYSTAGSSGSGLGAIMRLSDEHDIYSAPGLGTVIFIRIFHVRRKALPGSASYSSGIICTAYPGESAPGDAWAIRRHSDGAISVIVCDGLGHGQFAADASRAAIEAFTIAHDRSTADILQAVHAALRATRGGAAAITRIEPHHRFLRYCGIGNIAAAIVAPGSSRSLVSHNGTLGHEARRFEEYAYPWMPGATLVMHSDGLTSRWQLDRYPGILLRHPSVLAGVLYRDCARGRDDATIVAIRPAEEGRGF